VSNPLADAMGAFPDPMSMLDEAVKRAKATQKALPLIRGKSIDGVFYVRAEDVADALESQAPPVNRRLIDKLRRK
jgi:hypothetical protein